MVPIRRPDRLARTADLRRLALLAIPVLVATTIGIAFAAGGVAATEATDARALDTDQPLVQDNGSTPESNETDTDASGVTSIEDCTTIEQPGTYELAADLTERQGRQVDVGAGMTNDVCIGIRASGVVLEGNGHVVGGTGASQSVGVQIFDPDGGTVDDVSVRNLRVRNWHNGVEIGLSSWFLPQDAAATATLESVTTSENGYHGVYVAASTGTQLDGVTATDNGEAGVGLFDTDSVTISGTTASNNGAHGVALFEGVFDGEVTGVDAADNGGAGVYLGRETSGNTLADLQVTGNDGAGIERVDGERNEVQEATEGNG